MLQIVNTPARLAILACLVGCTGNEDPVDTDVTEEVPAFSRLRPRLSDAVSPVRDRIPARVITHLHSPWSHDACDGDGIVDGEVNAPCLDDLRRGLCDAGIDLALFSDHPDFASPQSFTDLWHPGASVEPLMRDGTPIGGMLACEDGTRTAWRPGIEDELMPLGLTEHVAGTPEERHATYNQYDTEALAAMQAAGANVYVAHTEQRDLADLQTLADAGLTGIEIFNAHAMFSPDIRSQHLGLDGLGWTNDIGPFTRVDGLAEPDLLFLGVLEIQRPSIEAFDDLLQQGPIVGIAGTDAHQNVLRLELRDGERLDSYRRALTWFSNYVYADPSDPLQVEQALARGESAVVFEVMGIPDGFDLYLDGDGITEMGGTGTGGDLVVGCPVLSDASNQGPDTPEVFVSVLKDGALWQSDCGRFPTDGPGVYRVQVDMVPHHLAPYLGDEPETFMRPFPWVLSNAIRVQ